MNLENICLSGGAEGADLMWGMCAGAAGHSVFHWSFQGHRSRAPAAELIILTEEQLSAADDPCKAASKGVKRWFPPKSPFVKNLLRRNWYQVKDAERVYAVATINKDGVSGGTAWAVQMFIDRFGGGRCEAYVFDQSAGDQGQGGWFVWGGVSRWVAILEPPTPRGVWAGIGSRDLQDNGKAAIRALLGWEKPVPHAD